MKEKSISISVPQVVENIRIPCSFEDIHLAGSGHILRTEQRADGMGFVLGGRKKIIRRIRQSHNCLGISQWLVPRPALRQHSGAGGIRDAVSISIHQIRSLATALSEQSMQGKEMESRVR